MYKANQNNQPKWNNNETTEAMDAYCENGPEDTISTIRFSTVSNINDDPQFVSTSSWDSFLKVWELKSNYNGLQSTFQGELHLDAPVLGHCWSPDNSSIFGAGGDNLVKMGDLQSSTIQQIGEHASGVKDIYFNEKYNLVISTGWDGHIKFWDLRSSDPCFDINLEPSKIWSFSHVDPLLVGVLNDNSIFIFNIDSIVKGNASKPDLIHNSQLKYQIRSIEAFPNAGGYVVSSIEGRGGIKKIDFNNHQESYLEDFYFKCHRKEDSENTVSSVHQSSFNAKFMTLATGGSDGKYFVWDKERKKRLKATKGCEAPITAIRMSLNAHYIAYAFGYDWASGLNGAGSCPVGMFVHPTLENEVRTSI